MFQAGNDIPICFTLLKSSRFARVTNNDCVRVVDECVEPVEVEVFVVDFLVAACVYWVDMSLSSNFRQYPLS